MTSNKPESHDHEKYSWEKIEENKSYVWHTDEFKGNETKILIAITDTPEKAHFLATAANAFNKDQKAQECDATGSPSKEEPPANSPAPDKEEWKEEGVVYIGKWVKASDVLPAHGKILWLKDQGKFSGGYYNEETGMFCTDERDAAPIEEIEWMQELPLEQKLNEQAQTIKKERECFKIYEDAAKETYRQYEQTILEKDREIEARKQRKYDDDCKMVRLQSELSKLRDWKESAMKVMPDMQEIGRLLNIPLGTSVSEQLIPAIKRLLEADSGRAVENDKNS